MTPRPARSPVPAAVSVRRQVAELLQEGRTARGWSRNELARRAEDRSGRRFHATVITRLEEERTAPSLDLIAVLFDVLDVPLSAVRYHRPVPEPWVDGSPATLAELDDAVAGRRHFTSVDHETGAREPYVIEEEEFALGELPEVPEEAR